MKGKILELLRSGNGAVSGEKLSAELGISRVSIWKHIRKLQELDYNITSTPKGYRYEDSPDVLSPWEFPGRESTIHYFPEVTSTMKVAADMARKGCPHFTVIIAGRQSQGRGRLQRNWLSSPGGLYYSVILRPDIPPVLSPRVNFTASLVLARTLRDLFQIPAMVKWPNDILVHDRKISGILSEMEAETDQISFINIGIGINVNNDPTPNEPNAISLNKILGKKISRKKILARFLDDFESMTDEVETNNCIPEWKKYTMTLNRQVKIVTIRDTVEGFARDVDENGALILELADGSMKKVIYGDCFHQEQLEGLT